MPLTPEERSRHARMAALTRWSREDPALNMARARDGQWAKFERQVDPDGTLDPAERQRRAKRAQRAHMIKLRMVRDAKRKRAGGAA